MTQQSVPSDAFFSVDEGHYNNSQSLILKEIYDDQPPAETNPANDSVSQIKLTQSQLHNPQPEQNPLPSPHQQSVDRSLDLSLDRLVNQELPGSNKHQYLEFQKAIQHVLGFNQCIRQKMAMTTELIEESNRKQSELYQLVHKLKDNLETPCQLEKHRKYQDQLKRNKQLMDEAERQLTQIYQSGGMMVQRNEQLSPLLRSEQREQVFDTTEKNKIKANAVRPFTDDETVRDKIIVQEDRINRVEEISSTDNSQNPFANIFKKSVLLTDFTLYQDDTTLIKYSVLEKGIKVSLIDDSPNSTINIRGYKGKSLVLSLDQLSNSTLMFEQCRVQHSRGLDFFEISIPLPMSLLFEPRFRNLSIPQDTHQKMKSKLHSYTLIVHNFDRSVWKSLVDDPKLLGLAGKGEDNLEGAISVRGTSLVYFVKLSVGQKEELRVILNYKSDQHLKRIVEFYKYLLCS